MFDLVSALPPIKLARWCHKWSCGINNIVLYAARRSHFLFLEIFWAKIMTQSTIKPVIMELVSEKYALFIGGI
jgi:hypothetical protein